MKYIYPAIFEKEDDGQFSVLFPDLENVGGYTCGHNLAEAMFMAEDCLGIVIYNLKADAKELPKASDLSNFTNTKNKFATLIDLDYPEYLRRVETKPVRKTLYIPRNLNDKADAMGINFSQVLRTALEKQLAKA